jgi:acyl-CoA thioester hydrolase
MTQFVYERRVAFSDTDAMGVVHHANYLRFCEEARVAWMRVRGLSDTHYPQSDTVLAVLSYRVWHLRPAIFEDLLQIRVQARRDGLKIYFQYAIYKGDQRIAEAETVHIPVDGNLQPVRPHARFKQVLEKEPWTETWLSNL